jgi:DNA-binding NarL/FixJ family response regulator
MTIRRVFAIWAHPLFGEAVRLLLQHPDVEWLGATSNLGDAQAQIVSLRPDTILIEELEGSHAGEEAIRLLENISSDVRIIRLSLYDNELTIYQRKRRTLGQAEDLLKLIWGE